jgi:transposase
MKPYSMDLRERVLADRDAGLPAAEVAAKYRVSSSWVRRLVQRRRETGSFAPGGQRHGPLPKWTEHADRVAEIVRTAPDATVAEIHATPAAPLSPSSVTRALKALGLTRKKKS